MYEFVDAALLRVAADPAPPGHAWPDTAGGDVAELIEWLRVVQTNDALIAAIETASPVLTHQLHQLCRHPDPDRPVPSRRDVQRAARATVKYLLRATTRATPFGLFAGVAPLHVGAATSVRLGSGHRVVARVDAAWLAAVLDRLHRDRALLRRLPVVRNDLAVIRDGRLVLSTYTTPATRRHAPGARSHADAGGPAARGGYTEEVSVRLTAAVADAIDAARGPVRFAHLAARLRERFPAAAVTAVHTMLYGLIDYRFLVTALHAPMTVSDPLTHLIQVTDAALAEDGGGRAETDVGGETAALLAAIRSARDELACHDRADTPPLRRALRTSAAARMRAAHTAERTVGVDLRVDADVVLPACVVAEAEQAAAVMARLAPPPGEDTPWGDYHRRFLDRYGLGALVPLQELLYGADGLGYPAGYRDSALPLPRGHRRDAEGRESALLALAHEAAWERRREVDLTAADLTTLTGNHTSAGGRDVALRPHVEIRAEIHARTGEALDGGEFGLAVLGVSRAAGTITGRFLDLLDVSDQARMRAVYVALPTVTADAVPVQVTGPPVAASATTITRSPLMLPRHLALAQQPGQRPDDGALGVRGEAEKGGRIELDDLVVSADTHGLYLVSVSTGRVVEPHLFGAIELVRAAHPTLRFLAEISTAATVTPAPFAWGPARRLPFLPRIRHGRTILTPARWRLHRSDLPHPRDSNARDLLDQWRERWAVPDTVLLGDDDRRLRLDLTEPAHRDVLHEHLRRIGHATVLEAPPAGAFGWIHHRPHEVVLPLAATTRHRHPTRPRPTATRPPGGPAVARAHLPGAGQWLSARLHGRTEHLTRVLLHLPTLLTPLDGTPAEPGPQWWFLRHTDPDPHLRLRVALAEPDAFASVAAAIGTWAGQLRAAGLLARLEFDTYLPETGRFGTGPTLTAAHAVFAADSAAALAQLQLCNGPPEACAGLSATAAGLAVTAASMLDLVTALVPDPLDGRRWLLDHAPRTAPTTTHTAAEVRRVRGAVLALTGPDGAHRPSAQPGGAAVLTAWSTRRNALAAYRDALLDHDGRLDPTTVLPDLLHLHHARMIGLSPDSERTCLHLARAAALSHLARTRETA